MIEIQPHAGCSRHTLRLAPLLMGMAVAASACVSEPPGLERTAGLPSFASEAEFDRFLGRLPEATWHRTSDCSGDAAWVVGRQEEVRKDGRVVVAGRVMDVSGTPLPGAQVAIGGDGVLTGAAGTFEIRLEEGSVAGQDSLTTRVQLIGYRAIGLKFGIEAGDRVEVAFELCELSLALESVVVAEAAEIGVPASITNVQHAGVDEGGIVKLRGEHLVVLRRGRLFTIDVGGGRLDPVDAIDAYAPGIDAADDWYDEILVSGDDVVVIGYSYGRQATEIGVFRIDDGGRLEHRATYQLRSIDYYSSRNYASRLVEGRLVLYTPIWLYGGEHARSDLPALRRWRKEGADRFEPIVSASRVHSPGEGFEATRPTVLHTVTICDLSLADLDCEATSVLGSWARASYVSPTAAYVWVERSTGETASIVYRIPLDGGVPTGLRTLGMPIDQFSFLEDADGHLNVVVRSEGHGEGMWGAEWSAADLALLRVRIDSFGDGAASAPSGSYRPLPTPSKGAAFHNRFAGTHLLYGTGAGWGWPDPDAQGDIHVARIDDGAVTTLPLPHGVDRIEPMGTDAVVIGGAEGGLHFTGVDLGPAPALAQRYVLADAAQGELRSHGFFYRLDDEDAGVLGLPVMAPWRPGWSHLVEGSASVVFIRNADRTFEPLGSLVAEDPGETIDDACVASCVDWYGNARPLFIDGRVFALMGYEIVEGTIEGSVIRETRRVSFAPGR